MRTGNTPLIIPRLFFVFLFSLCGPLFAETAPLTVGAILPLTGGAAEGGTACRNGMLLAYEDLAPAEQLGIRLRFEDNAMTPALALSAFKKLVTADRARVFVAWDSTSANALAPLCEVGQHPFLAAVLDPNVSRGRNYVFSYWVRPEAIAKAQIDEAMRRGYKRIARVTGMHEGILAIRRSFDQQNNGRLRVVLDEDFPGDVRDFRAVLNRLRAIPRLDAIEAALLFGQVGLFAKQAREMGVMQPLFGIESMEEKSEVEASQGALIGQWYAQSADAADAFRRAYQARFPGASLYTAGHCYDIMKLIALAQRTKQPLPELLRGLKNYPGVVGTVSATGDNRFTLGAVIREVTKDGFVTPAR